jgi:ABC-type transport system involved in cytochrome bd biosynthesis fused ATPase/permease subunit
MIIDLGASGCGKSTAIQLIERFYDANIGRLVSSLSLFSAFTYFRLIVSRFQRCSKS